MCYALARAMDMMEKGQGRVVKLYGIVGDCKSLAFTLLEERFDSFIILHITTFALKGLLLYPLTTPFTPARATPAKAMEGSRA